MQQANSYLARLTSEERTKFAEFKTLVDPDNARTNRVLIRFLVLCKYDIKQAAEVLRKFDDTWNSVNKEASDAKALDEIATRKMVFGGLDPQGRQIVHFHYHLHDPSQFPAVNSLKMFMLLIDVALDSEVTLKQGMIFLCWMKGSGWSNFDLASEKIFMEAIYSFAPMSYHMLAKMVLIDSPWYVWAVMKMMQPFITSELRAKLQFASKDEVTREYGEEALKEMDSFYESVSAGSNAKWI
jgi:hypothetical protein